MSVKTKPEGKEYKANLKVVDRIPETILDPQPKIISDFRDKNKNDFRFLLIPKSNNNHNDLSKNIKDDSEENNHSDVRYKNDNGVLSPTNINKDLIKKLNARMNLLLKEEAKSLGLVLNDISITLSKKDRLSIESSFSLINHFGMDFYAIDYVTNAEKIGFSPEWLGRIIQLADGAELTITGFDKQKHRVRVMTDVGSHWLKPSSCNNLKNICKKTL